MAMLDDRRAAQRFEMWFPMEIEGGSGGQLAISHNASRTGALVASTGPFEVGADVMLRFLIGLVEPVRVEVRGRVLRHEHRRGADLWQHLMAVEFHEPVAQLEKAP